MNIRQLVRALTGITAGLSLIQTVLICLLFLNHPDLKRGPDSRIGTWKQVALVRQRINDATDLARTYVVSGDPQYLRLYEQLVSLPPLMPNSASPAEELTAFEETMRQLNELRLTESEAIHAFQGLTDDGSGEFTAIGTPNPELALRLLHEGEYQRRRSEIRERLDELLLVQEARTTAAIELALRKDRILLTLMLATILVTLAMGVVTGRTLSQRVCQSIGRLQVQTESIATDIRQLTNVIAQKTEDDFSAVFEVRTQPVNTAQPDEIGDLMRKSNQLIHDLKSAGPGITALKASEQRYRDIVLHSPDLIFINRNQRVVYVNPAGLRLLRATTEDQVLGHSPLDFFHPDSHSIIHERISLLRLSPSFVPAVSEKIVALDGAIIEVESMAVSFWSENQLDIQVICRDVTRRRRNERLLATEAAVMEAITRGNPLESILTLLVSGMEKIIPDGVGAVMLLDTDSQRCQLMKAPNLAESCEKAVHAMTIDRREIPQQLNEMARKYGFNGCWISSIDNSDLPQLAVAAVCLKSPRDPIPQDQELLDRIARIVGIAIEQDRKEQELRASELRFRRIFQDAATGIAITSLGGRFLEANSAYCRMVGYAADELDCVEFSELIQPEQRSSIRLLLDELVEGRRESFVADVRCIDRQGGTVWSRMSVSAMRNAGGQPTGVVAVTENITDRKRAESSLAASAARFRQLAESMPVIVWTAAADGTVDYANHRFAEYSGVTVSESATSSWQSTLHPEDIDRCMTLWMQAVKNGDPLEIEYRIRRGSDGSYRWFRVQATPIRNARGEIEKWYGSSIDIHETRCLKEEAIQLATRLSTTLESITDAFLTIDSDWQFSFVNTEAEKVLEQKREDLLGRNIWEVFPEAVGSSFQYHYERALQTRQTVSFTEYYPPLQKWFEVRAYPSDDGLTIYFRDFTEQRRSGEVLRLSEERFRLLSNATNDAIRDWDLVSNALWWNENLESLFGYCPEEVESTVESWTSRIHPEDRDRIVDEVHQAIRERKSSWTGEYRYQHSNGSHVYVLDRGNVICDETGHPRRMVSGMTDLTERRMAEIRIQHLNSELEHRVVERTAQLESANKELEAFSYSVSHDLRAPLRSVDSFSRIVLEDYGPQLDEEGCRLLNIVRTEAQRMAQLIDDLLSFSRMGRSELQSGKCNLQKMFQAVWESLPAESRSHVKQFDVQPMPSAFGDRNMVQQVLTNLLANAAKFSRPQPDARIEAGGRVINGMNEYYVRDNGVGFDPRYAHKLFGVFQRLHAEHEFEGTGVGLAIVQRIVLRHGGEVRAEATPGTGAIFYFSLPGKEENSLAGSERSGDSAG